MSKDIIFIDHIGIPKEFAPIPAITKLPNWYKELDSYIGKEKKPMGDCISTGTVKKCIPFLDAMTAGYYLLLPADVYFRYVIIPGGTKTSSNVGNTGFSLAELKNMSNEQIQRVLKIPATGSNID